MQAACFLMKGCENVKETLSRRLCDWVRVEGSTDRRKRGQKTNAVSHKTAFLSQLGLLIILQPAVWMKNKNLLLINRSEKARLKPFSDCLCLSCCRWDNITVHGCRSFHFYPHKSYLSHLWSVLCNIQIGHKCQQKRSTLRFSPVKVKELGVNITDRHVLAWKATLWAN